MQSTATAFVAPTPLLAQCATRRSTVVRHVRPRVVRRTAARGPRMDLATELLVKAFEVGAATYATRALSQGGSKGANGADAVGGVRDAVPNFAALPETLRTLLEAAEQGAEKLPAYLEDASPDSRKWIKLGMCVVIDLIGSGSLPIPFVADVLDLAWAPVDALALQALFGKGLVTAAGFAEEILPGTDGIPTATLAWVYEFYGNDIRRALDSATDIDAAPVKDEPKPSFFQSIFGKGQKVKR